jgi:hypothetical protein
VNSGGEPERDEYGLPPVDIEIPDDARELDRDVQAYYRELRAERRRLRRHRLHLSLARDGIVLPLLACCLILALITGTLLTVFTATSSQDLTPQPGSGTPAGHHQGSSRTSSPSPAHSTSPATGRKSSKSSSPSTSGVPAKRARSGAAALIPPSPEVQTVSPLPAGSLIVDGQVTSLQSLSGTILVLLPPGCGCARTVSWLAGVGDRVHALVYIVGTPSMPDTMSEAYAFRAQLSEVLIPTVSVATDTQGVLYASYGASGLTAVLVSATSTSVFYAHKLSPDESPVLLLRDLES